MNERLNVVEVGMGRSTPDALPATEFENIRYPNGFTGGGLIQLGLLVI